MKPTLYNSADLGVFGLTVDNENQAVFSGNPARPESGEVVFEGFGLTESIKGGALDVFEEGKDLFGHSLIRIQPPGKFFPGVWRELDVHSVSGSAA